MDKINRVTLFLILTFSISFSLVGLYKIFGGQYGNQNEGTILAIVYMFIPSVCAIIVQKVIHKEPLTNLFISFKINQWFFIAWLVTPLISFGAMGISLLFPEVSYSPEMTGMVKRFENMLSPEQMEQMKKSIETLPIHPICWL